MAAALTTPYQWHGEQKTHITTSSKKNLYSDGIYPLKGSNRNSKTMCEICSKLTIYKPWRSRFVVFSVNLEQILHLVLVFRLLTLIRINIADWLLISHDGPIWIKYLLIFLGITWLSIVLIFNKLSLYLPHINSSPIMTWGDKWDEVSRVD